MKLLRLIAEAAFAVAICLLATLVVVWLVIHAWGWKSDAVASWVQAIGSVLAIIGAYIIGERQSRATLAATNEAHRLAERTQRDGILSVIKAAHNRAKEIDDALGSDTFFNGRLYEVYHPSLIDSLIEQMSKLPVHALGSDAAVGAFVVFSGQFTFLKRALEKFMAHKAMNSDETEKAVRELCHTQGYERKAAHEMLVSRHEAMADVLRKNVRTHITRIDSEFCALLAAS